VKEELAAQHVSKGIPVSGDNLFMLGLFLMFSKINRLAGRAKWCGKAEGNYQAL
jgi:hypothetical protein